jgi:2-dehydro-3-deoxygalactonokinase
VGLLFVGIDAGTTRTRAFLVDGERILARAEAAVGARDTARDGDDRRLRAALRASIAEVAGTAAPRCIAAAGMVTSPQGLVEVAHVLAPAGLRELAAGAHEQLLPDVSDRPFLFVPGVRTAGVPGALGIGATDVMRGEETLCLGLVRTGGLAAGGALLSVGSHWKLVRIDEKGRVAGSITSLAGEMVRAVREETILASALPPGPLASVDAARLLEGMDEARRGGLSRALFCVRLLELAGAGGPEGRLSFLAGAFIGADLDRLQGGGALPAGTPVTIAGGETIGGAWTLALERRGFPVRSLPPSEVDAGLVAGLGAVMEARGR